MWMFWWVWAIAAVALATLEVFLPSYFFLGFAIGAGVMAIGFLLGGPTIGGLVLTFPVAVLLFAVVSLISWLLLRRFVGIQKGQVKVWHNDINDD